VVICAAVKTTGSEDAANCCPNEKEALPT